jgi:hypothetical protein
MDAVRKEGDEQGKGASNGREESTAEGFATSFTVARSPEAVFAAVNDVRAWWSGEIEGRTDTPGAEFTYRYRDVHRSKQKITELVPGKRVVWHVTDAFLSFAEDKTEWNGTDIVFEIAEKGARTELRFTHVGLVPECECYRGCAGAWSFYINESLQSLLATGRGAPNDRES